MSRRVMAAASEDDVTAVASQHFCRRQTLSLRRKWTASKKSRSQEPTSCDASVRWPSRPPFRSQQHPLSTTHPSQGGRAPRNVSSL
ncbi:MAG: hypothetical protein WC483_00605 [Candidatus Paceibacterota bacterium]